MAELDDFFAKKDKKKSKTKTKFVTADELVKNLEDTTKKGGDGCQTKKGGGSGGRGWRRGSRWRQ